MYEYLAIQNQPNKLQNKSKSKNRYLETAQKLTSEALLLAQPSQAPTIAYQWQWQLGRLANIQGENKKLLIIIKLLLIL